MVKQAEKASNKRSCKAKVNPKQTKRGQKSPSFKKAKEFAAAVGDLADDENFLKYPKDRGMKNIKVDALKTEKFLQALARLKKLNGSFNFTRTCVFNDLMNIANVNGSDDVSMCRHVPSFQPVNREEEEMGSRRVLHRWRRHDI